MIWKNETRRGEIIASSVKVGKIRLSVHLYVGCGATWFASCYGFFEKVELGEMPLNQAQVMAASKLQTILEESLKVIITG